MEQAPAPEAPAPIRPPHPPTKVLPPGTRVGLLAGYGRFPILFATLARERGLRIVTIAFRGEASPELAGLSETLHWCGIARMGRMIRLCKREGLAHVVMAGKIHKTRMYDPLRVLRLVPDWRTIKLFYRRLRDRADDSMMGVVAEELAHEGITLESAAELTPELLAPEGVLSARAPTAFEERDVAFGWQLAKRMGDLDVGQSVAVREQAVLAVEAIEGTDANIRRAATLCRGQPFTVVKVAKPRQDMRWDVPVVGTDTIRSLRESGARCLAIEAGRTYLLDPDATLGAADAADIAVVSRRDPDATP
jgi:DUF1009 family protein